MIRISVVIVALALQIVGTDAPSAVGSAWMPAGKWTVDYAEERCVLAREFSSAGTRRTFSVQPWLAFSGAKIVVTGEDASPAGSKVMVTLLPAGTSFEFKSQPDFSGSKRVPGLILSRADQTFADAFARSESIEIVSKHNPVIRLSLKSTASAVAALRTCEEDRLRSYGLDPAQVVAVPIDSLLTALSADAYPPEAIRAKAQGTAIAAVAFDRTGRSTTCKVVKGTGNQALDRASCTSALRVLRLRRVDSGPETRWTVYPVRWTLPFLQP